MRPDSERPRLGHYFDLPPRWRWVFWLVLALSAAGAALGLWWGDAALTVTACVPLIGLPVTAAWLYWFSQLVFKATELRRGDLTDKNTSGEPHS